MYQGSTSTVTLVLGSTAKVTDRTPVIISFFPFSHPPTGLAFYPLYLFSAVGCELPLDLTLSALGRNQPDLPVRPVATRLAQHGRWPDLFQSRPRWELQ